MKQLWMTGAAGVMALSIAGVNAQSTGGAQPQTPQTTTSQQATAATATTVRGCVYKERDIPGRAPNVAERAGVMEDYILVPAAMDHSQHAGMTGGASGTTGGTTGSTTGSTAATTAQTTAGTSGAMTSHLAYKLEKVADERLRAVVGKMVEVSGRIDASATDSAAGATAGTTATSGTAGTGTTGSGTGTTGSGTTAGAPARDRGMGPDRINLPEFEVVSLKEVEGTCPATPTLKK